MSADLVARNYVEAIITQNTEVIEALKDYSMECYIVTMQDEYSNQVCEVCRQKEPESDMLVCDHCSLMFHMRCYNIPSIPLGYWYCNDCAEYRLFANLNCLDTLDPVENEDLLSYLADPESLALLPREQREQVAELAELFELRDGELFFKINGGVRKVPSVGERKLLVK